MRYENKPFTAERIMIEGNEYIDCTFVDCTICYAGGLLAVERCKFVSSIQLALGGAAENTARFLRSFMGDPHGQIAVASVIGIEVPNTGKH